MDTAYFLHQDTEDRFVSLHDCRADQAMINGGVLSFVFRDGIRLTPDHPENPTADAVRTGLARVDFPLLCASQHIGNVWDDWDDVSIHVFKKLWFKLTVRQEWSLFKLLYTLNTRKAELEFITGFDGYLERLYECCLWQKRKPYHRDCYLRITSKQPIYRWNEIRTDSAE